MPAQPLHRSRRLMAAIATTAVAGGALAAFVPAADAATATTKATAKAAAAAPTTGTITAKPTDDAYVDQKVPARNTGTATKVVAATTSTMGKRALLRFSVPALPAGATVTSACLVVSSERNQPTQVDVSALASSAWTEKTVTWTTAPKLGARLASVKPAAATKNLSVDLTKAVKPGATQSFAITVPSGVSEVMSKEAGASAPKLVVKWTKPATVVTSPPPPVPTPPAPTTLFGTSLYTGDGSTFAQALARQNAKYGKLEVVRVFYTGLPAAWPGNAGLSGGPVVVSFKANPADVLAGKHDAFFSNWFATAPRDREIFWTFFHEPEDDIQAGRFTAAQYRDAYRRLDTLADKVGNPRLKTTTVWMCHSLRPGSGRDWHDYYPGGDVVDVLGWDCYNNRWAQQGTYPSPETMLGDLVAVSKSVGKPWGMGEIGSLVAVGDDGTRRDPFLRSTVQYLRQNGAVFANYFDAYRGQAVADPEYRLLDAPSAAAWRWAVSGS